MAVRVRQASRLPCLITGNARQARRLSYQGFPKTYMHPSWPVPLTSAKQQMENTQSFHSSSYDGRGTMSELDFQPTDGRQPLPPCKRPPGVIRPGRRKTSRVLLAALSVFVAAMPATGLCAERGSPATQAEPSSGEAPPVTDTEPRTHPFLFFTSQDMARLRAAASSTHKAQFDSLQAWGRLFADFDPLPADKLPTDRDVLQVYYENAAPYVINMALLHHLTGERTYYESARKWLLALCSYPSETDGGYFVGAYALGLAGGYDMLHPWLSEQERSRIRDHLVAVLERGKAGTKSDWWWGLRLHHDHWLPAAGLCAGALAVRDETAGGRDRLRFFVAHFRKALEAVGEDGAWTEGVSQWTYAMSMTFIFYDAYKRVTGEDLFRHPVASRSVLYRLYHWLPNDTYVAHHDSFTSGRYNVMGAASSHLLRKLAAELRSGHAQWLAERDEPHDLRHLAPGRKIDPQWMVSRRRLVPALHSVGWNFLWYDPAVKPTPPAGLPNHHVFANQGVVVLRSGWESNDVVFAFTCAPLGGHRGRAEVLAGDSRIKANIGHIHALAGSVDLFAYGNHLAVAPGYGMRDSRHHSTLTIEGCDQRLDPAFEAKIVRQDFAEDCAYIAGEASACYPPEAGLRSWVRHVAWLAPDVFVIADDLTAARPSAGGKATVWRLDYNPALNDATLKPRDRAFLVAPKDPNGPGALWVRLLAPTALDMDKQDVRPPNASWIAFGQVRASITDIFRHSARAGILAVLAAMRSASTAPPAVRQVSGEGVTGAVVDFGDSSRAAVFVTDGGDSGGKPLSFEVAARGKLTCQVFSLAPDSAYEARVIGRGEPGGKVVYAVTIGKGTGARTNAAGTLVVSGRAPE
ncbi:MAG TPA: DUF4962 domain-containing protein [Phycisphaerae bacterium]|nr:DUF4962 domain-containing protein [Phycisphaerae bacterium]